MVFKAQIKAASTGPTTNPVSSAQGGFGFVNGKTINNTLAKVNRAIIKAQTWNSLDSPILAAPPDILTANDGSLGTTFWVEDLPNLGVLYFNLLGGNYFDNGTISGARHAYSISAVSSGGIAMQTGNGILEFCSDAPRLEVRMAQQSASRVEVAVGLGNSAPQYITKTATATAVGGGEQQIVFDWKGVREERLYRVHSSNWFSRITMDANSRIWAPAQDNYIKAVFVGDSYVGGTGATYVDGDYVAIASYLCGFQNPWQSGIGGTGYVNPGAATPFISHISDVINANPDIVVIAGGTNDTGSSAATVQAAVLLYIQTLRAGLPTVPIVVLGVWPKSTGPSAAVLTTEGAVSAAVTQFNDPLCVFEPIATDPTGSWIFGTGNTGAPAGNGNADLYIGSDGTHPNDAGYDFLGRRSAVAVQSAIRTMISNTGLG